MRTIVSAGLIALSLTGGQGQAPARDQARLTSIGTATVSGVVLIDDATRAPLRRTTLTLQRLNSEDMRTATSDDRGQFVFDGLPAGSFRLTAAKGGYVGLSYGAPKPGGMPGRVITLTEGQRFSTGTIAVMRGAVVAGRLLDRNGLPVAGAEVTASRFVTISGERLPRIEDVNRTSVTNAHGEYRIYGLVAGDYMVFARSRPFVTHAETTSAEVTWASRQGGPAPTPGRTITYAPTIFPGVVDPNAAVPVVLARGEERLGVDFSLQSVPVARVSGVVTGPDGKPAARVIVQGVPKRQNLSPEFGFSSTFTGPDGRFLLSNIVPGDHAVVAATAAAALPGVPSMLLWGRADLSVFGQDVADLSIQLQPGVSVSGKLVTSAVAGTPLPDLSRLRIALTSSLREMVIVVPGTAQVSADGTFTFERVLPGSYRLTAPVPAATSAAASPWSIQSAMLGDRDIADIPFEVNASISNLVVTLTDVQAQVSGMLTDRAGQPASDLYVLMFSTDRTLWSPGTRRTKSARALENGSYAIDALPAGEFYLCAVTELDPMLINDPSYLEQLIRSSIKITLADGEKKKQDLRIGR
jgi:hypothetical protein